MSRIVIDPVTRTEGNLRIELDVAGGTVRDAWASGTMFRGVESILEGRDPRDAWLFAERICGSCGPAHALASVRAVERSFALAIPRNARLIRNILLGCQFVAEHVAQFYLHDVPDWVDLAAAVRADPTAALDLAHGRPAGTTDTVDSIEAAKDRLAGSGLGEETPAVGLFAGGSWGHPSYRLAPDLQLLIAGHLVQSLDWLRGMSRMTTILGGRDPHPQTFLVGGMALVPEWRGPTRSGAGEHPWPIGRTTTLALGSDGLAQIADLLRDSRTFVEQAYLPDVFAVVAGYPDWATTGRAAGHFLSFGEFPADDGDTPSLLLPRGRVMDRDLSTLVAADQLGVAETVVHSHYVSSGSALQHPSEESARPVYAGPTPPFTTLATADRYSWIKAARYEGDPMEVGPLARMLVGFVGGVVDVRTRLAGALSKVGLGPEALFGTLGRMIALAVETELLVERIGAWLTELKTNLASGDLAVADITMWDPSTWPSEAKGWAVGETPRGALGHWVSLDSGRVRQYRIVDASTWNASPRDARGVRGPLEAALVGTPIADPANPLEALRVIHSFAPCTPCAVHAWRGPR